MEARKRKRDCNSTAVSEVPPGYEAFKQGSSMSEKADCKLDEKNSTGPPVDKFLQKIVDLKAISDHMVEMELTRSKLVNSLLEEKEELHLKIQELQQNEQSQTQRIMQLEEKLNAAELGYKELRQTCELMVLMMKESSEISKKTLELIDMDEEDRLFLERRTQEEIGVKRMVNIDHKLFFDVYSLKYPVEEAEEKASDMHQVWYKYLSNQGWYPFKVVIVNGQEQEIIDEEDEKLKNLKKDLGEEVCKELTTVLKEINDVHPRERFIRSMLWNFKEGRAATVSEAFYFTCLVHGGKA